MSAELTTKFTTEEGLKADIRLIDERIRQLDFAKTQLITERFLKERAIHDLKKVPS